jgi:sortase B
MFDGTKSKFGALFIDAATEEPFRQFNTIIYGHHMRNGSMFGDLKKLKDPEYCRKHPKLELVTPYGKYHLMICAFLNQPDDSDIYRFDIGTPEERQAYIQMIKSHAEYLTGENIKVSDRLVVLSTCAYEYRNARYIVVTRMVPWN